MAKLLPQYPGAVILGDFTTTGPDSKASGGVQYESGDSPADIILFYEQQLEPLGWSLTLSESSDKSGRLFAEMVDWECSVIVNQYLDKVIFSIRVYPKE